MHEKLQSGKFPLLLQGEEMEAGTLGGLYGRFRLSFPIYVRQDEARRIRTYQVVHIVQFY